MRAVPVVAAVLLIAGLTACKREPTFEERYAGAEKAIRQKATELEQDMQRRAQATQPAPAGSPAGPPSAAPSPLFELEAN